MLAAMLTVNDVPLEICHQRYKQWYSSTFSEDTKGSRSSGKRRSSDAQTLLVTSLSVLVVTLGLWPCVPSAKKQECMHDLTFLIEVG